MDFKTIQKILFPNFTSQTTVSLFHISFLYIVIKSWSRIKLNKIFPRKSSHKRVFLPWNIIIWAIIQSWIKVYPWNTSVRMLKFSQTYYLLSRITTTILAEVSDAACSRYGVCTQKEWISSLRTGRKILWLDARDLLPLACTVRQFNKLPPVCSHPSCSSSQIHSRATIFPGMLE